MEQEPSELEESLRAKISEIFKEPYSIRIKKEQKFRSLVMQVENMSGESKHWTMVRRNFYNKNYQHIPYDEY